MSTNENLSPEIVKQLLRYDPETGLLFWRHREDEFFPTTRAAFAWNSKYANKQAFTCLGAGGYYKGGILGHIFQAHRVIWALVHGEWPDNEIDHLNHERGDNRIVNLRAVTRRQNQLNHKLHSNSWTGVHGVDLRKGKWRASIRIYGDNKFLGSFATKKDAVKARKRAEKRNGFHPNHGLPTAP